MSKPLDCFTLIIKKNGKTYHYRTCRECRDTQHRAMYAISSEKDSIRYSARMRVLENKRVAQLFLLEYKNTHPCIDCGFSDPRALQFDHVRGTKHKNVSLLIRGKNKALLTLKNEIDKCEIRCANCHSIKTLNEQQRRKDSSGKRPQNRTPRKLSMAYVLSYKASHPCVDCNIADPRVLVFDHVRDTKHNNVGTLASNGRLDLVITEIAKCEVRCANCHSMKTAIDQHWYSMGQAITPGP